MILIGHRNVAKSNLYKDMMMSIVREFKQVVGQKITIHLPDNFSAQEVEAK